MTNGPLSPYADSNGLPLQVHEAMKKALRVTNAPAWMDSKEMRRASELWLEPSYRLAVHMGMTDHDYARFVELGYWNLAGDTAVNKRVTTYWNLAGDKAWMLIACGVSPETIDQRIEEEGISIVIETAENMIALRDFGDKPARN